MSGGLAAAGAKVLRCRAMPAGAACAAAAHSPALPLLLAWKPKTSESTSTVVPGGCGSSRYLSGYRPHVLAVEKNTPCPSTVMLQVPPKPLNCWQPDGLATAGWSRKIVMPPQADDWKPARRGGWGGVGPEVKVHIASVGAGAAYTANDAA